MSRFFKAMDRLDQEMSASEAKNDRDAYDAIKLLKKQLAEAAAELDKMAEEAVATVEKWRS